MPYITAAIIGFVFARIMLFFFPIVRVYGDSMEPTLHHGDFCLCRRVVLRKHKPLSYFQKKCGRIFVVLPPANLTEGRYSIKRLTAVFPGDLGNLWFVGDNPRVSFDSRKYGLLSPESVAAIMITKVV